MDSNVRERTVFPFPAVLGQERIKNALIWNLVNPKIGGVLISGEKGTAKSTLVRGISALSDNMGVTELPLNITEDRLVGSIDLRAALKHGRVEPEPGILAKADGNILYVDEVNLLSDHIVNALLETAASGVNILEREGISYRYDARFILVGSMNPEEGKLRPQLLDRFGLYVEVEAEKDADIRMEIMRRRLEFERNFSEFTAKFAEETQSLRQRICAAIEFLPRVQVSENALRLAAKLSAELNCAGHRGELAVIETAMAIAAMSGRTALNTDDLKTAAEYALSHRAAPPESGAPPPQTDEPAQDADEPQDGQEPEPEMQEKNPMPQTPEPENMPPQDEPQDTQVTNEQELDKSQDDDIQSSGETFEIPYWQDFGSFKKANQGNGRRNRIRSGNRQGRYVGYRFPNGGKVTDLAFDATVRAAAPYQNSREKSGRALEISGGDLREKIREKRTGGFILFVVDASSSMGANKRMREVKAAILSLLNVSYQKRDRVGMIAFRKDSAELLLGFTRSVELAQKKLEQLPTGGKTPLAEGLTLAYEIVMGLRMRDPDAIPTIILVSDGRANGEKGTNAFAAALKAAKLIGNQGINTIVIDTENDFIRFGLCKKLNENLRGIHVNMEELHSVGIVKVVDALKEGG